jgi:hypothetical protein
LKHTGRRLCRNNQRLWLSSINLVTLEPGITENQTDEMKAKHLQLVVPAAIHETYKPSQQDWLMCVADFVELVKARQD